MGKRKLLTRKDDKKSELEHNNQILIKYKDNNEDAQNNLGLCL